MRTIDKLEKSKTLFVLINLCVAGFFLLLNILTPLFGDDFMYQNIFGTSDRVTSFADIIQSQITHYNIWGGRFVVHVIDQFFLMYDKIFFNIANTVVFMFFSLLIYYNVYKKEISNTFLLLTYVALWFSIPGVGYSILWQTMSCNYLWGSTIILAFFTPYFSVLTQSKKHSGLWNIITAILMLLFGIIAGWTIEAGGAMLLFGVVIVFIMQKRKKLPVPLWEYTGFIGALCGYAVLIVAPGNYARSAQVTAESGHGNIIVELAYRIARETYYMLVNMNELLFFFILFCIILSHGSKIKNLIIKYQNAFLFALISIVGVYVMTAAAGYAERVLVTPIAYMIIAVGLLYKDIIKNLTEK